MEKTAWKCFVSARNSGGGGNAMIGNDQDLVKGLLDCFKVMRRNLSLKIISKARTWISSSTIWVQPVNMMRDVIKIFQAWNSAIRANGVPVCLLTTAGHSTEMLHKQNI